MTFAAILEAILAFLKTIPLLAKYFPPKTAEEKTEEGEQTIDEQIKKIETEGRP